jgi:amino acid transporter
MNIRLFAQCAVALFAASLLGYAFSYIGVAGTVIDSFWKLVAFDLGLAIIFAFSWPHIRGVRKGDGLATDLLAGNLRMPGLNVMVGGLGISNAFAAQNGRMGQKIRIHLSDGRRGEARILEYAGTFSPARVQILEMEKPAAHHVIENGERLL